MNADKRVSDSMYVARQTLATQETVDSGFYGGWRGHESWL